MNPSAESLAHFSQAVFGFGLIVIGYLLLWRSYALDCYRQDLFAIRNKLFFDAAQAGAFGDPAYRELRQTINGFIRYGHDVGPFAFVVYWLFNWGSSDGTNPEPDRVPANEKFYAVWLQAKHAVEARVVRYLFLDHSFLGPVVFVAIQVMRILRRGRRPAPMSMTRGFQVIEKEAFRRGRIRRDSGMATPVGT